MKTKLLTIFLLLFTSQVFAEDVTIKCGMGSPEAPSLYRYIDRLWGSKVQHKVDGEWMDIKYALEYLYYKRESHPEMYNRKVEIEIKDKSVFIEKIIERRTSILDLPSNDKNIIHTSTYIDFDIPSIQIKFRGNFINKDVNYECDFIKHGE